jgi:predicted 3-demethylubiquinone-9 3-methyltransferase (glyoxalase superfamily)
MSEASTMPTITPCLWFDNQLEEAIAFYGGIFPDTAILEATRHADGKLFVATFRLAGRDFMGLNGGPMFTFTEAISLSVACRDQAEIDGYWSALGEGGTIQQCGWLKDRYGLSWQIVPDILPRMMNDPDRERSARVQAAVMGMVKLDIAALEKAFAG